MWASRIILRDGTKKKSAGPAPRRPGRKKSLPAAATPVPKRRGRPRAYEPEVALARALDVFWKEGFAATSLDDLSAATGMNRPSFYGAFGDKRELYIKSYESYRDRARQRMGDASPWICRCGKCWSGFMRSHSTCICRARTARGLLYRDDGDVGSGVRPFHPPLVMTGLVETDRFFARIFKRAQERGELAASARPEVLALLASGTLHTIAVRARAQVPRAELDAIVNGALDVMCGPKK